VKPDASVGGGFGVLRCKSERQPLDTELLLVAIGRSSVLCGSFSFSRLS
jgi:hypothetical protein